MTSGFWLCEYVNRHGRVQQVPFATEHEARGFGDRIRAFDRRAEGRGGHGAPEPVIRLATEGDGIDFMPALPPKRKGR